MSLPWHREVADGTVLPLAFLKIDLEGSTALRDRLPAEAAAKALDAYRRTVEGAMAAIDALPRPPHWSGDGASFFIGGERPVALAAEAALGLVRDVRILPQAELHLRIAIGFDDVEFHDQVGTIHADDVNFAGHLEAVCPRDSVLLTEQAYRVLRGEPKLEREFEYFATHRTDRCPAYVAPRGRKRAESRHPEWLVPEAEDTEPARTSLLAAYDDPTFRLIRFVGVRQFERLGGVELTAAFCPLSARPWRGGREDQGTPGKAAGAWAQGVGDAWTRRLESTRLPLPRALPLPALPENVLGILRRERSLVLLGDPGAGKSTLLRYLALTAAAGRRQLRRATGIDERLLPLHVSVGRLAALVCDGEARSPQETLARYFEQLGAGDVRLLIRQALEDGSALLLFDGLDETPRAEERRQVERFVEAVASRFRRARVVVASRAVGYAPLALPSAGTWVLEPLDYNGAAALARAFYAASFRVEEHGDDARARRRAELEATSLLTSLSTRPALAHFRSNPLLLTLAALVHTQLGRLPRYRALLYKVAAQTLIEAWATARLAVRPLSPPRPVDYESEGLAIFPALALELHTRHAGGLIGEAELLAFISERLPFAGRLEAPERCEVARDLLLRVSASGSVLIERGAERWGFLHQSLQEYLAAKALAADDELCRRYVLDHLYDPRFAEVWRLVAGEIGIGQERPPAAARFVRSVLEDDDELYAGVLRENVLLAAACIADTAVNDEALVREIARALRDAIVRLGPLAPDAGLPSELEQCLREWRGMPEAEILSGAIAGLAESTEARARVSAATGLGLLGVTSTINVLVRLVRDDPEQPVRLAAASALGEMGSSDAVDVLRERLSAEDSGSVFDGLVMSLVTLGKEGVEEDLSRLLESGLARTGLATAAAIGLVLLGKSQRVISALGADDANARVAAATGLLLARTYVARDAAAARVAATKHVIAMLEREPDSSVLGRTAWALARRGIGEAGPTLLHALERVTDPYYRGLIVMALSDLRLQEAIPILVRQLADRSDGTTWRASLRALAKLDQQTALPELLELARDGSVRAEDRVWAIECLADAQIDGASGLLLDLVRDDREDRVRGAAAAALGRLGAVQAEPLLLGLLEQGPPSLIPAAADALAALSSRKAIPILRRRFLETRDPETAATFVVALAGLGDKEVLGPILTLYKENPQGAGFLAMIKRLSRLPPYRTPASLQTANGKGPGASA